MIYSFDVALSTHDLLRRGVCEANWSRVCVVADDDTDAALLAAQLAHTMHGDAIVTAVLMRI